MHNFIRKILVCFKKTIARHPTEQGFILIIDWYRLGQFGNSSTHALGSDDPPAGRSRIIVRPSGLVSIVRVLLPPTSLYSAKDTVFVFIIIFYSCR